MKRAARVVGGNVRVEGGAASRPLPADIDVPSLDWIWRHAPESCNADVECSQDYYDKAPAQRIGYAGKVVKHDYAV